MKILIIEDEPYLNESMVEYLSADDFVCESVYTFDDAYNKIGVHDYDCIVLDIMLPDGSGLDLLKLLKKKGKTEGVIIISAKDALDDKLEGLQLGADDYLTKPFHLSELSIRIAAIIRRRNFNGQSSIQAGDMRIDLLGKSVTVLDQELELTNKEFQLLLFLVINKNKVLSKNAIAQHLWGDIRDFADNHDFIYTHIKNIRKKILAAGGEDCIKSMYGMGYKMLI
ncbi:response regulator transcription factor [Solitalea lacus]|uniref:response regulator transcription factor n=1 Tax=Solitalea lacus TaxID=2911172 RepID=UPI001ED9DE3A|nr:response regulator transcription factor [Solitalea lacus]UKJ08548.1 response regulator transcription factor [Solitalea lacus]